MPTRKTSRSRPKHRLHPSGRITTVEPSAVDRQAKREAAIAQEQFDQGRAYELLLAKDHLRGPWPEAAAALERGEHRR